MTTARELLTQGVSPLLNDPGHESWSLTELLAYLNGGLQRLVEFDPPEFTKTVTFTTEAGAKQKLPADGILVVSVLANVKPDGSLGRLPHATTRRFLGFGDPDWMAAAPAAPTTEWAKDEVDPRIFWLSPPALSGQDLMLEYVAQPDALNIDAELPVRKPLEEPLVEYVLYRALSKDTEYAGKGSLADLHHQAFLQSIGVLSNGQP